MHGALISLFWSGREFPVRSLFLTGHQRQSIPEMLLATQAAVIFYLNWNLQSAPVLA